MNAHQQLSMPRRLAIDGYRLLGLRRTQSGASLIVAMLFLIVLALLGISGATTGILEERMAGNARDENIAFQAAEAALRDAEIDLDSGRINNSIGASPTCANGFCDTVTVGTPLWITHITNNARTIAYGTHTANPPLVGVSRQPRYLIEYDGVPDGYAPLAPPYKYTYRITAIGYGMRSNTTVVLQEVYFPAAQQ